MADHRRTLTLAAVLALIFLAAAVAILPAVPAPPTNTAPPVTTDGSASRMDPVAPTRGEVQPAPSGPSLPVVEEGAPREEDDVLDGLPSDALPGEASVWPADGKGVSGAVRESTPRLRRCYEAALVADPELGGKVVAHFELASVEGTGRVTNLELETTTEHDELEACVSDVLAELAFDEPDGVLKVSYPLVFATAE